MNLKIGTLLIDEKGERRVVTKIENGFPVKTESVETFVAGVSICVYNGEPSTIREALGRAVEEYIRETDVQHLSSDLTGGS